MENKYKTAANIFIVIGLLLTSVFLLSDYWTSKEMKTNNKQIYVEEISGVVSFIHQNRGTIRMDIKDPYQKYYFGSSRNYKLTPYDIHEFIQPGDSVFKEKNTMKLEVFKGNKKYYFILEESINK